MPTACDKRLIDHSTGHVSMTASSFYGISKPEKALLKVGNPGRHWGPDDLPMPFLNAEILSEDVPTILKIEFWVQNVGSVTVEYGDGDAWVSMQLDFSQPLQSMIKAMHNWSLL